MLALADRDPPPRAIEPHPPNLDRDRLAILEYALSGLTSLALVQRFGSLHRKMDRCDLKDLGLQHINFLIVRANLGGGTATSSWQGLLRTVITGRARVAGGTTGGVDA